MISNLENTKITKKRKKKSKKSKKSKLLWEQFDSEINKNYQNLECLYSEQKIENREKWIYVIVKLDLGNKDS